MRDEWYTCCAGRSYREIDVAARAVRRATGLVVGRDVDAGFHVRLGFLFDD